MSRTALDLLETDVEEFGAVRFEILAAAARGLGLEAFDAAYLAAIGHRATRLRNVVSGHGHLRGVFAIDIRRHRGFLQSVPGCLDGGWRPLHAVPASRRGHVPPLGPAAAFVVSRLRRTRRPFERGSLPTMLARDGLPGAALAEDQTLWPEEAVAYAEDITERAAAIRMRATQLGWPVR